VDRENNTNVPGIFAAGDVTDQKYKQIIISMGSGRLCYFHDPQRLLHGYLILLRHQSILYLAQDQFVQRYHLSLRSFPNVDIHTNARTAEVLGEDHVTGLSYEDMSSGEMKELSLDGIVWISTLGKERKRSCNTVSAFSSGANSNSVTCLTIPAKSIAASTPELPPPITATFLFSNKSWRKLNIPGEDRLINKGVAFCPHCDGPLFENKNVAVIGGGNSGVELIKRSSPGIFNLRQLAPVEIIAVLLSRTASFSKVTRIALSVHWIRILF
jgi:alkyl hydroperoxide reductase subunit AhpF